LGDRALANVPLAELALPELRALTRDLGLTSRLAVMDRGHAVVVARIDGPGVVRFDAALGRQELLHCTAVGKAMLAAMTMEQARAILRSHGLPRRTPRTLTRMADVLRGLGAIRERGYAVDDEEDTEGVVCVGSCVRGRDGAALSAVSVSSLKGRDWAARQSRVGARVADAARAISRLAGGPDLAQLQLKTGRRR
jgi:IclR family acetate operon transcriptional repressor